MELKETFPSFLAKAELKPGTYTYKDRLSSAVLSLSTTDVRDVEGPEESFPDFSENKIVRFFQILKFGWQVVKDSKKPVPETTFEFKEDHLKLIRALSVEWVEPEVPLFSGSMDPEIKNW